MNNYVDDILNGERCQSCGEPLPTLIVANGKAVKAGFPRTCRGCTGLAIRKQTVVRLPDGTYANGPLKEWE